jgi:hypothetical protein
MAVNALNKYNLKFKNKLNSLNLQSGYRVVKFHGEGILPWLGTHSLVCENEQYDRSFGYEYIFFRNYKVGMHKNTRNCWSILW